MTDIMKMQAFSMMQTVVLPLIFAIAGPTDEKIRELKDSLLELNERAQVIQNTADAEKRALTEDEDKELQKIFDQFESIELEIERRQLIAAQAAKLSQPQGRITEPNQPESTMQPQNRMDDPPAPRRRPASAIQTIEDRGKWGWKHMGEFAAAVTMAARKSGPVWDPRLTFNAPTTYSSEGVGEDGGIAVPPDFRTAIWQKVSGEGSFIQLADPYTVSGNSMTWPADETTPWDTTGGIQAYFESEASQINQSKIALQDRTIRLNKLTALVPVTSELLEDTSGLDSYLRSKVGQKFDFKLKLKMLQGTGAGEPLGALKSTSFVSVAKEAGQNADTLLKENVDKMWSRMYAPCRANSVWLINQDVEPQLDKLQMVIGVGGVPVYLPPGGIADTPYARLKGRPVVPTQACETLGDQGDIVLIDWKQYMIITKTAGMRSDVSMHLWFDYDVMAYRFILRISGMPHWKSAITPRDNANNTLSWCVTLDERA